MKLTKIIIIFIICIMMIQVKSKEFHTGYHYLGYQPEEREDGLYRSYLATQSQYDPRKEGMITRIKDQGNTECCWAFATIAMAESNLIKQKLADKDIDLSEHHLSYFLYNSSNDPLNNTFQDKTVLKSYLNYLNAGGNYLFSFQFLSRYSGMVNENIVSSIPSSYENIQSIDHIFQYNHNSYTLKNTYYSLYNIENIKKMIDQYGAVGISYQYVNNPDTMNFEHNAIYNPDGDEALANHSVVIVGWDDYYDKNNFSTLPQNNGAWLIKNSWGEVGSEDGYFWMSYEEPSITDVVAAEFEKVKYDYNYHYDGNLNPSWATFENQMTFANIYQVKGNKTKNDELLKAVNIGIQSTDTKYSIQIYRNIKNNQDPTSGTLVNQEPIIGKTTYSGLYTIELDEPITLAHDDYYSIVVTLNKPNDFVKMFVESYQDSDWVELQLGTKENQSFYYEDNKWKDLHNESATARIKGLTVNAQTKSASHVSLSKTQTMIIGERKKLDVHLTSSTTDSKLLWQSSHPDIVEIDKNGYITALSLGQATITVTTEYGATASCLIEVSEKDIGIKESQNTINDINKKDLKTKRVGQHIVNKSDKSVIDLYIFLLYFGGLGMMICIYKRKYL